MPNVRELLDDRREWVTSETWGRALAGSEGALAENLCRVGEGRDIRFFRASLVDLGLLQRCYGARGVVRVHDSDSDGWGDVSVAMDFCAWRIIVATRLHAVGQASWVDSLAGNGPLAEVATLSANLACCSADWAGVAYNSIGVAAQTGGVTPEYLEQAGLVEFVLRLRELVGVSQERRVQGSLGGYREIFSHWDDQARLGSAMAVVCDEHVRQTVPRGAFAESPFDLLPTELMLLRTVWERIGLVVPDVAHPLVEWVGGIPAQVPLSRAMHPLLDELAKRYGEVLLAD